MLKKIKNKIAKDEPILENLSAIYEKDIYTL